MKSLQSRAAPPLPIRHSPFKNPPGKSLCRVHRQAAGPSGHKPEAIRHAIRSFPITPSSAGFLISAITAACRNWPAGPTTRNGWAARASHLLPQLQQELSPLYRGDLDDPSPHNRFRGVTGFGFAVGDAVLKVALHGEWGDGGDISKAGGEGVLIVESMGLLWS